MSKNASLEILQLEDIVTSLKNDIKWHYRTSDWGFFEVLLGKRRKTLKQLDRLVDLYKEDNNIASLILAVSPYIKYNELFTLLELSYQKDYQPSMFNIFCATSFPGIQEQYKKWSLGIMYKKRDHLEDLVPLLNRLFCFKHDLGTVEVTLPTDVMYYVSNYIGEKDQEYFIPLMNACLDLELFTYTADYADGIGSFEIKSKDYIRKSKFQKMVQFSKKYMCSSDFNNVNFVYYFHHISHHLHDYVDRELSGNLSNQEINNLSQAYQLALGYVTKGEYDDYTKGFMNLLLTDSLQELNYFDSIEDKKDALNKWSLNVITMVKTGSFDHLDMMLNLMIENER